MGLLVRKINRAKWMQNDICGDEAVSADAITNCMKTTNNTLSAWRIDSEDDIDDAILVIVSNHQHLDTIDVVCLNPTELSKCGISLKDTAGQTPIKEFVQHHVDISDLTYKSLGDVADQIIQLIKTDKIKRYTRPTIKKLLQNGINSGLLRKEDLPESIIKHLE